MNNLVSVPVHVKPTRLRKKGPLYVTACKEAEFNGIYPLPLRKHPTSFTSLHLLFDRLHSSYNLMSSHKKREKKKSKRDPSSSPPASPKPATVSGEKPRTKAQQFRMDEVKFVASSWEKYQAVFNNSTPTCLRHSTSYLFYSIPLASRSHFRDLELTLIPPREGNLWSHSRRSHKGPRGREAVSSPYSGQLRGKDQPSPRRSRRQADSQRSSLSLFSPLEFISVNIPSSPTISTRFG